MASKRMCRHGVACWTRDCKFPHPVGRVLRCPRGERCRIQDCTEDHPNGRHIDNCGKGEDCRYRLCLFQHPNGRKIDQCNGSEHCNRWSCQAQHPNGRDIENVEERLATASRDIASVNELEEPLRELSEEICFPLIHDTKYNNNEAVQELSQLIGDPFVTSQFSALLEIFSTPEPVQEGPRSLRKKYKRILNEWICATRCEWSRFIICKSISEDGSTIQNMPSLIVFAGGQYYRLPAPHTRLYRILDHDAATSQRFTYLLSGFLLDFFGRLFQIDDRRSHDKKLDRQLHFFLKNCYNVCKHISKMNAVDPNGRNKPSRGPSYNKQMFTFICYIYLCNDIPLDNLYRCLEICRPNFDLPEPSVLVPKWMSYADQLFPLEDYQFQPDDDNFVSILRLRKCSATKQLFEEIDTAFTG